MDEAYVVLVADASGENICCQAFPFATKHGAQAALAWFEYALGTARVKLIDDHEHPEHEDGPDMDEPGAAALERERIPAEERDSE